MAELDFISTVHQATARNYLQRVVEHDKAECAAVAKKFGQDYFDGDRKYGYGGFKYDGRWIPFARQLVAHYGLKPGDRVLDIGCGKGFLVHDFMEVCPGIDVSGVDISEYAVANGMPEVRDRLKVGNAVSLPYPDKSFDLVVAINTLHNLRIYDLEKALREIERVGRGGKYIVNDSYRTEREKVNLLYWQITCESFYTPPEWEWIFARCGYTGDYGFIFFE
ncbi:MAG: class I SAM-dependent methyltransferase [Verrucomicrobia bacterium]|nr:class I SAM-dependent methyltransferase [Verrucomicrobiota bacterium]